MAREYINMYVAFFLFVPSIYITFKNHKCQWNLLKHFNVLNNVFTIFIFLAVSFSFFPLLFLPLVQIRLLNCVCVWPLPNLTKGLLQWTDDTNKSTSVFKAWRLMIPGARPAQNNLWRFDQEFCFIIISVETLHFYKGCIGFVWHSWVFRVFIVIFWPVSCK